MAASSQGWSEAPYHDSLVQQLSKALPEDSKLRIYHIVTLPTPTAPIYASSEDQSQDPTVCETHFVAVSQAIDTPLDGVTEKHDSRQSNAGQSVLILGIEVLVFTTNSLTTIFVSKADSTGFLERSGSRHSDASMARTIVSTSLNWLVQHHLHFNKFEVPIGKQLQQLCPIPEGEMNNATTPHRPTHRRLVLSLFARSQNQYLFPGSVENETKHVLDDRQLVKWWCKVLNPLVHKDWTMYTSDEAASERRESFTILPLAHVLVPGCDDHEVRRSFLPSTINCFDKTDMSSWRVEFPSRYLAGLEDNDKSPLTIRNVIPRLPDDPKARYCEDLDDAGFDAQGQWKSIRTTDQFWETMAYRQECASGRLVGFIWLTFGDLPIHDARKHPPTKGKEKSEVNVTDRAAHHPSIQETATADAVKTDPRPATNIVVLTSEQYITQADFLLNNTDYAGKALAIKSTKEWIAKVEELGGVSNFGIDVCGPKSGGRQPDQLSTRIPAVNGTPDEKPKVNILTGIKKKRKVSEASNNIVPVTTSFVASDEVSPAVNPNAVRTLPAGLVRKKPKTAE